MCSNGKGDDASMRTADGHWAYVALGGMNAWPAPERALDIVGLARLLAIDPMSSLAARATASQVSRWS